MNEEERKALIKAHKDEFKVQSEEDMRKAYRECAKHLEVIQEEMGLSRIEALYFLANMCSPNRQ